MDRIVTITISHKWEGEAVLWVAEPELIPMNSNYDGST